MNINFYFVYLTHPHNLIRNAPKKIIELLEEREESDLTFSFTHPLRLWAARNSSTKTSQITLVLTSLFFCNSTEDVLSHAVLNLLLNYILLGIQP